MLIGETAPLIKNALQREGFRETEFAETLGQAVEQARRAAGQGWNVLLSPACASFDMFKDYEERGRVFKNIVNEMEPRK